MNTYVIVYEGKYATCCEKYEAEDIFEAIKRFMLDGNEDQSIISITVGNY